LNFANNILICAYKNLRRDIKYCTEQSKCCFTRQSSRTAL